MAIVGDVVECEFDEEQNEKIDNHHGRWRAMNDFIRPAYLQLRNYGLIRARSLAMGRGRKLGKLCLLVVCLGYYGYCDFLPRALAHDDGRYAQSPLKSWFDSLRSKAGVPCCDVADGQRLDDVDWESRDGHYRVRIKGQWYDVPTEAVIEQANKFGPAVVWPYDNGSGIQIRCFIPGAGA